MNNMMRANDRTTATHFQLHLSIALEWLQFLGHPAFALYSFYKAMAAAGIEMGQPKIAAAMSCSRQSIRRHTEFLELCGLIHTTPGDTRTPNSVAIIDPPQLTEAHIKNVIWKVEQSALLGNSYFLNTLSKRSIKWQPCTIAPALNGNGAAAPVDTTRSRRLLAQRLQEVCAAWGVKFTTPGKFVNENDNELIADWLDAVESGGVDKDAANIAGLIYKMVTTGEPAPIPLQNKRDGSIPDQYEGLIQR